MTLHLFEYIAREVLLGWWRSMAGPSAEEAEFEPDDPDAYSGSVWKDEAKPKSGT